MKTVKLTLPVIFVIIIFISNLQSQDKSNLSLDENVTEITETDHINKFNPSDLEISNLEKEHKAALEAGNYELASGIEKLIDNLIPSEYKYRTGTDNKMQRTEFVPRSTNETDWLSSNTTAATIDFKSDTAYNKRYDMKTGEDKIMYLAYCFPSYPHSGIRVLKSSDFGASWNFIMGVYYTGYISNLSLLVESRNNSVADSVRLFVFFNLSSAADYSNSDLRYFTVKANGTDSYDGIIATPGAGSKFSHISAVSDGAFYQNATYFGVVCTESDNAFQNTTALRFFRTINWGAGWTGTVLGTGYNDFYPSAEYKEGSSDSLYIAVERRFSPTQILIRVLATPWTPSINFRTEYLTSGAAVKYEKPCLTVKQVANTTSVMITSTKNNTAVYHYTSNAGESWSADNLMDVSGNGNAVFTYCSSAPSGTNPFVMCWLSQSGDSLNIKRGIPGSFGSAKYKINHIKVSNLIMPVCVSVPYGSSIFPGAAYSRFNTVNENIYFNQEGLKHINVKVIPQGFYRESTSNLICSDTVKMYVRKSVSPYNILDSSLSLLMGSVYYANFYFKTLPDGDYFIELFHRNSIRTWSSSSVTLSAAGDILYDFTVNANTAFGNNEVKVENSPARYGMYSGDINQDGIVDASDLSRVENSASSGQSGYVNEDVTGDDYVDADDMSLVENNASNSVEVLRP